MRLRTALTAIAASVVVFAATGSAQQGGAVAPRTTPARLVVIGDLHADLEASRQAFRLVGATNDRDAWIGGNLVVVQMGDLIGRGFEDREVLDFVLELQTKARAGGGTVHVLLGNHEVFAARPDHRWVDPAAFGAFDAIPGLHLSNPRIAALPGPARARAAAFMPGGLYAKRVANFPAVLRIGATVFAHGGVLPQWARHGIDRINAETREWLNGRGAEPASTLGLDDGSLDDGVMWSRHFAAAPEEMACPLLDESLSVLGATRMIVAHTVQKVITSRCGGRVWAVDVGISRYYGGSLQAIELVGDNDVRVLRPATR